MGLLLQRKNSQYFPRESKIIFQLLEDKLLKLPLTAFRKIKLIFENPGLFVDFTMYLPSVCNFGREKALVKVKEERKTILTMRKMMLTSSVIETHCHWSQQQLPLSRFMGDVERRTLQDFFCNFYLGIHVSKPFHVSNY